MLDVVTKNRINAARDILVGKVPDPKSQVEQITIALIYKFMDDMDAEAEELGGKRTFFTGKYSKYGWRKIFDPKLSGFEMLSLYSEAIQQMNLIPTVPQLFRDIFKNAYLPYRDPETLKAFLKVINEFTYDHSEKLGDAFEFLLSVLGSQGDAGQFRTPRHIIDFMVRIADPKKNERILDPACGTAGFLISSYKHILKQNSKDGKAGRGLTTDDRKKLAQQLRGYDISPDMVRLSLVNMYLHGFTQPNILEYDTLTSEERWNEYYDVVMANPPFMSPKGGIRPHKRFSVQSNRSEVLFVDYIAEHLSPNGRAAVIVPEGIIFQSGTAYKALRKMLVENYLWAVVSLPAGVFQPYSGVKTSILLMDKTLARGSEKILFAKIQNDGFDLGAQRRPINKSDLYFAEQVLKHYQQHLQLENLDVKQAITAASASNQSDHEANEVPIVKIEPCQYLLVEKHRIAESGEYNLSGDRYKQNEKTVSSQRLAPIGELCILTGGGTPSKQQKEFWTNGRIKWISSKHINDEGKVVGYDLINKSALENSSTKIVPKGSTIVISRVSVGKVAYADDDYAINQDLTGLTPKDSNVLSEKFLFIVSRLLGRTIEENAQGIGVRGVTRQFISKLEIPLPALPVQQQIVAEIEQYRRVIDGARQVIENYKPNIRIKPDWKMAQLGDIIEVLTDYTANGSFASLKANVQYKNTPDYAVLVRLTDLRKSLLSDEKIYVPKHSYDYLKKSALTGGEFLIANVGANIGDAYIMPSIDRPATLGPNMYLIKFKKSVSTDYVYFLNSSGLIKNRIAELSVSAAQPKINKSELRSIKIPLPSFEEQEEIVRQLEMERILVEGNKQLIARMEQKIKETIAQVWGEEKEAKEYEENEEVTMAAEV